MHKIDTTNNNPPGLFHKASTPYKMVFFTGEVNSRKVLWETGGGGPGGGRHDDHSKLNFMDLSTNLLVLGYFLAFGGQ